eukprot:7043568-Pyramimonas_sp.AAC.1
MNGTSIYSHCQMCKARLSLRAKTPAELAAAEAKKRAKEVKREAGLRLKAEVKLASEGYQGTPSDPWYAQPVPHEPSPPRAPGSRSKAPPSSVRTPGSSSQMSVEEARR